MEILQLVRVRRQRWRVHDVRAYDTCRLLTLAQGGHRAQVLTPFDDVDIVERNHRPLRVSAERWRYACRSLIVDDTPPGCLRSAARARIDLMRHQLEPALAVVRGASSRILLADDVGLGKTVQAGLIVSELLARQSAERVLILTPAGVRDQCAAELRDRFAIDAELADAATLRALASSLPLGMNPWRTIAIAVASIDYVKRPEVLPAVLGARWDVVVVDEAHASAGDSERRAAVAAVAARAAYVVLATATPHNGDDAAFADLCALGGVPDRHTGAVDPLLIFRRTRRAVYGENPRHIHILRVRRSAAERHMHDALDRYRQAVAAEHGERVLALAVLDKRGLSSPWSLAQSVDRRLAALASPAENHAVQLALPLGDPDGELTVDDAPPVWPSDLALADAREDRRLLTALVAAARTAALHDDSKLRCLRRLLRRVGESAIVFTEYRDTASHVLSELGRPALLLHGGMARRERAHVIDAFTRDPGSILVATDAAGQGLNLHHSCRFVINLELPWNPMRLEQRIGRVDRIGQKRRVHAVHFVANATTEIDILSRLQQRITRASHQLDSADPVRTLRESSTCARVAPASESFTEAAQRELERLTVARAISASEPHPRGAGSHEVVDRPLVLRVRRRRLRAVLAGRVLEIYRVSSEDGDGCMVESRLVSVIRRADASVAALPTAVIDAWCRDVTAAVEPFLTTRIARERNVAAFIESAGVPLFQAALFDRRADRERADLVDARRDALADLERRLAGVERRRPLVPPTVVLVLIARP